MSESMECRSLREHYDKLIRGIQDPEGLADELFSGGLIPKTVRDKVHQELGTKAKKMRKLLSAVEGKIAVEPDTFDVFLIILKQEPTLQTLADRLKASYGRLMEASCRESLDPSRHWPMSHALSQYAAYLHNLYQRRTLPVCKGQSTPSKHYIHLAVISREEIRGKELDEFTRLTIYGKVDDIIKKKKPIELDRIGRQDDGSFTSCVLVEGAPGVGKTTLAWELCRRWKEILPEFNIVLLLILRDRSIQEAKDLSELFRHPSAKLREEVADEIIQKNGLSVLLILEGYDEMPEETQRDSIFSRLIEGTELPRASILVTTRPSSGRIVHEKCQNQNFQHIEIVGFTSADIDRYIHDVMGEDKAAMNKFYEYLHNHPQICTMMSNPLNCGLTIKCYQYCKGSDVNLKTQTELYSNVTRMLVVGELSSKLKYSHLKEHPIRTLSDLPEDAHQILLGLSRFAYEGIIENKLVFQNFPSHLDTLGLVQKSEDLNVPGTFSYNFIHLTLQEYLAAYHISLLPPSKQAECIDTHIQQDHMQVVLRFLAGLTKFKLSAANRGGVLESIKNMLGRTPLKRLKSYIRSPDPMSFIEAIHWLLEMQDSQIVQDIVGRQSHECILSGQTLNPFTCYALGYCIQNSECEWKLELKNCNINNEAMQTLCQGSLQRVEKLDLSRNKAPALGGFLSAALRSNFMLTELRLEGCGMNKEGVAKLTSVLHTISSLRVLDLSLNVVGVRAAKNLGRCCKTVTQLYLVGCSITDQQIREFVSALHGSVALRELWLQANPIGKQGALDLAKMIRNNSTLVLLSLLGCNSIGFNGASSLVKSLSFNSSLRRLQLSETFKTACEDYSEILLHRLDWCTDFTQQSVVKIKMENIDCEVFAHALRGNTVLTELRLVRCCIDSSDVAHLRLALKDIHTLAVLDLHGNGSIGNNGTKELALILKEHPALVELGLRFCGISSIGVSNLRHCLKNIAILDFSGNEIGNSGAKLLAQALAENTALTHLELYNCGIGAGGIAHLSSSLSNKPHLDLVEKDPTHITQNNFRLGQQVPGTVVTDSDGEPIIATELKAGLESESRKVCMKLGPGKRIVLYFGDTVYRVIDLRNQSKCTIRRPFDDLWNFSVVFPWECDLLLHCRSPFDRTIFIEKLESFMGDIGIKQCIEEPMNKMLLKTEKDHHKLRNMTECIRTILLYYTIIIIITCTVFAIISICYE